MAKRIRQVYKKTTKWRLRKKKSKARTKAKWAAFDAAKPKK